MVCSFRASWFGCRFRTGFENPFSQAIVVAAHARGRFLPAPPEVTEIPGEGVCGSVDSHQVFVGGDAVVARRIGDPAGIIPIWMPDRSSLPWRSTSILNDHWFS